MNTLPLTVYELLVYVGTGVILLATVSVAGGYAWIPAGDVSLLIAVLWFVFAYVSGHVVGHLSGYLIEDLIVRKYFDPPDGSALFVEHGGWRKRLFPAFFRVLPLATQDRITAEARRRGLVATGRALFLHCFAIVRRDAVAFARMNAFLNQYGFCRNMVLVALVGAILFTIRPVLTDEPLATGYVGVRIGAVAGCLAIAIVMFYRYLKFYRLYSHELFTTYAESATAPPQPVTG